MQTFRVCTVHLPHSGHLSGHPDVGQQPDRLTRTSLIFPGLDDIISSNVRAAFGPDLYSTLKTAFVYPCSYGICLMSSSSSHSFPDGEGGVVPMKVFTKPFMNEYLTQ